jgi:hypothetical protein
VATIKQVAQKFNLSSKKLLNEIKKKFPEQTWTLDSELPEGFEDAATAHAQEYADASGVELPKGELTTSQDAVGDSQIILESIEYGVIEAISQMRSADLIESAQLDAIADIQTYESSYNSVWEMYFKKKVKGTQQKSAQRNEQKAKHLIELNKQLGNRQGELIRTQQQLGNFREESHKQTQLVMDALLK